MCKLPTYDDKKKLVLWKSQSIIVMHAVFKDTTVWTNRQTWISKHSLPLNSLCSTLSDDRYRH